MRPARSARPCPTRSTTRPAARAVAVFRQSGASGSASPSALGPAPAPRAAPPAAQRGAGPATPVPRVVDTVPDWSGPTIAALLLLVLILAARAYRNGRRARTLQRALHEKAADNAVLQAALVPALPERLGGVALSVDYRPADGLA